MSEENPPSEQGNEYAALQERLKTGRNERCPCGSGKKYKKCCLDADEVKARTLRPTPPTVELVEDAMDWSGAENEGAEGMDDMLLDDFSWLEDDESELEGEELDPAVAAELQGAWNEFEAVDAPSTHQMDELLEKLLRLPPHATSWGDLLHAFTRFGHIDLPGVFRRIAGTVPHTPETEMSWFYWAAAEEFSGWKMPQMLPEVAAGYMRLDLESYDLESLQAMEDYLVAEGFDVEALQLLEKFLPILRVDEELPGFVVPETCIPIYQLRVGKVLREAACWDSVEALASELQRDMQSILRPELVRRVAEAILNFEGGKAWSRAEFEMTEADFSRQELSDEELRLHGVLIQVAREAWEIKKVPPGTAFRGLQEFLAAAAEWEEERKKKKQRGNLLDYLRPSGLERRVAESCPGILGVNWPQVWLMLLAHEILTDFAARHGLIGEKEAEGMRIELKRLNESCRRIRTREDRL